MASEDPDRGGSAGAGADATPSLDEAGGSMYLVRAAHVERHAQTFSHPWNPHSEITGTVLGRAAGLRRTGVNYAKLAPGKESFVYHSHRREEEWIYVLRGRGIAEIDGREFEVGPGDFMGFPTPSVAHHLRNPGPDELHYLMGGESRDFEIADFPKLRKTMVRDGAKIEIYDAEDARPFGPLD